MFTLWFAEQCYITMLFPPLREFPERLDKYIVEGSLPGNWYNWFCC